MSGGWDRGRGFGAAGGARGGSPGEHGDPSGRRGPRTGRPTGGLSDRLRPLAEPHVVTVTADAHGTPTALREGRRWRRVEAVRERWRIDDEWWRRPVTRVYHRVVLEDGALRTLYRDLEDGRWYLHG